MIGRGALGIAALCVVSATSACSGTWVARGTLVRPAQLPLRTFPLVLIASSPLDGDEGMADVLAAHLGSSEGVEVRRVRVTELEPMRRAGTLPSASVVVIVETRTVESVRPEWTSRPETACVAGGCYTADRPVAYEVSQITMLASIWVHDGPSARRLQEVELRVDDEGVEFEDLRARARETLSERVRRAVDSGEIPIDVELLDVDLAGVGYALRVLEAGGWSEGRRILARLVQSRAFTALDAEDRARVLYDLGQAVRFDVSSDEPTDERLVASAALFRAALHLDPDARYAHALASVDRQRNDEALFRAQQRAREHNFALGAQAPVTPAGYGFPVGAPPQTRPSGTGD